MNRLFRFEHIIAEAEIALSSFMILIALCISLYAITWRNLGYGTGDWVLELPITLVSWAVFIGTGANIAFENHIKTDFFVKLLHKKIRKLILLIMYIILLISFLLIFYYAVIATESFAKTDYRLYEMFFTPFYIVFIVMPISAIAWCFHIVMRIIDLVFIRDIRLHQTK